MTLALESRRAVYIDITEELKKDPLPLSEDELKAFEEFDLIYRCTCALLYNYVPMSGHPGGSISSGRFVSSLLFETMDYDMSNPNRRDADMISYAAGHKALGLYTMWALRNEVTRIAANELLPNEEKYQLRLEDLLGFRRNPITKTPLFLKFKSKALDGHPTPITPFIRLSTGASGVGVASSLGLAYGAVDYWADAPKVHIIEGEGGMTPGRVAEAFAAASAASLSNAVIHIDWNQASIDSNKVCRVGDIPGDYLQWNPMEFAYLHDWNVIYVPDGKDFQQIVAAQRKAMTLNNGQPTAIVYSTIKGWQYGIEGRASHGAGHKLCSDGFYQALAPLDKSGSLTMPRCEANNCGMGENKTILEECFWDALQVVRKTLEEKTETVNFMASRLKNSKSRLDGYKRKPRENAPKVEMIYETAVNEGDSIPEELLLKAGTETTLRAELGKVLNYYNKVSGGAIFSASADLLGSTSVNEVGKGFGEGFFNTKTNTKTRNISMGGICEDAMCGIFSGVSSYGYHIGAGSSYGAFLAPLGHIAARLHAIGNQARKELTGEPYKPFIMICAHTGIKTGEDGPTHADPQPLQLLQGNFPKGFLITLTPWDPQEIWTLVSAAFKKTPAVIAPFVTRPNEKVYDRENLGLEPISSAANGLYLLRKAKGKRDGTIVLQESGVTYAFIEETLPLLEKEGIELDVFYVASSELFDSLSKAEQESIFPQERAQEAMGITGFTLPTMYRWITSEHGRNSILHPFRDGHFLGSGQAEFLLEEAGLNGKGQFEAIMRFLKEK